MVSTPQEGPEERILELASRLFFQLGFQRVSMDELARQLGMSKKTLYTYYASKEALLEAVLRRRTAEADRALSSILTDHESFDERVRAFLHFLHGKMTEISPAFLEDMRRFAPGVFRIVEEYRAEAIPRYFRQFIEDGVRDGHVREDVDREVLIRMIAASIQGIVRPEIVATLDRRPAEVIEAIIRIIFLGVLTPQGRESGGRLL